MNRRSALVILGLGCASVTAGIAMFSVPLAFIAGGLSLVVLALLVNYR